MMWEWTWDASCRDLPPEAKGWFFDHEHNGQPPDGRAIDLCDACPVRGACLDHALHRPETSGVWGGHTAKERREIRKGLRLPRAPYEDTDTW